MHSPHSHTAQVTGAAFLAHVRVARAQVDEFTASAHEVLSSHVAVPMHHLHSLRPIEHRVHDSAGATARRRRRSGHFAAMRDVVLVFFLFFFCC